MDYSDDENEESSSWQGVPGTIVLINIFDPSTTTAPVMAHAATCLMTRQLIRLSSTQSLGVSFYGTENINSSAFNINGVVDIFPLKVPTLQDLRDLRGIDIKKYEQAKEFKLSDILWHASKMFAHCKKAFSNKTVIILSRLDVPPIQLDQKRTLLRVVELIDADVEIRLINISDNNNVDSFYKQFLIETNKGKEIILPKPLWHSKDIALSMYQETNRHLAVARLSFEIGNGMAIGVGVYRLLRKIYNKKVPLDRESNALLTSVTKTAKAIIDEENQDEEMKSDSEESTHRQMPLLKTELLKYQEYGGERVEFTENELKKIGNPFGPPMMKLLGFKPASNLCKEKWFLKTGYFLFPSENVIEGSTVAFKSLHRACIEMSVVALCVLCTRVNSRPNIVALVPCTQPLGLDVEIGFDVVHIPFVEHKRDVPNIDEEEERTEISLADKTAMTHILNNLKFDYKHDTFENPKLESEYRAIEMIALKDAEPFIDSTKRDPKVFENIQADLFEEIFGPFGTAPKRNPITRDGPKNKITKVDIDEDLLQEYINKKSVKQHYNVAQLKQILKSKDIPDLPALTGLKKDQLVDLVYKYFG